MHDAHWLAAQFESQRSHLRAVALRMLGSPSEADDAVQEAWLRLSRADTREVENLAGWLTTVVARVSLDALRARKTRREESIDWEPDAGEADAGAEPGPEQQALLADAMGPALLLVLETLNPAERLAFVLHDLFAVSFEEIAPIVGTSAVNARQLASRARRRVQGAAASEREGASERANQPHRAPADPSRQRRVVDAFLCASRNGDFAGLLAVLDPDVVLRADPAAVLASAARQADGAPTLAARTRGAQAVAEAFNGRARAAQPALIDGAAGAVWAPGGTVRGAFLFAVAGERIAGIEVVIDPQRLRQLRISIL
ncbi:sigma-70 family RNA polymerase sigma factor [Lysobacter sp. BMK333-48F3]|uniref:sigma-70 family RNA polymerase sigma factor n=1 Tax=Lysobacter sp. BMK333-48F3 TaxID=2867962 RepID=UPI001C8B7505|nr:sigma-70 family RNA polymerase sigma factor [Lysobacter sp. BMK333-48F3]MBX9402267.1 sigma-70 family RNA polymerase sigma factor [Lysobacter sp. BMK333-48F3]